ncbi:MAG TPA: HAD family hydrolase, partial [Anaerolineaceae bacterium]
MDTSVSPKALVFDWGDTLMTTFPDFQGAMVDWPVVAAEDGAPAALVQLKGHYRLLVGTNAANSSASQVLAALQRVGLGQSIERVFTVHELGSRKPEAAFYQALQAQTGLSAGELVMIGDDYSVDVLGAWQAGWRSVWYNPKGKPAPGLLPVQDLEIKHLSELPAALETTPLPRLADCLAWLQREGAS